MTERELGELLLIGDVHLGRRPVGMDEALAENGLSARDLSPTAALAKTVDYALANPPRAVVFAGDLVDHDDDLYEAYPVLEREVKRLGDAGIAVVAIAGNHDGQVLPKLIKHVEGVRLLGQNGVWERWEVPGPGRPIDLLAWSFPERHFSDCPLDHGDFQQAVEGTRADATVIGILHTDLNAGQSNYAPVSRSRLEDTDFAAWFLGHVHRPDELTGAQPIGYLGSLVGLDFGETGLHGAWRVGIRERLVRAQQLRLEPLRWERVEVALTDADSQDEASLLAKIKQVLQSRVEQDQTLNLESLLALIVRVSLTGELRQRDAVSALASRELVTTLMIGDLPIIIERVRDQTRESIDLEALARERSPLGFIAQQILDLQAASDSEVDRQTRDLIDEVRAGDWELDEERYPLPEARQLLERASRRVLNTLLRQRHEASP